MAVIGPSFVARVFDARRRVWLASSWIPVVAALVAVLLCAPSLGAGLMLDDHLHRLTLLDRGPELLGRPGGALDLFRFLPGDPAFNAAARVQGTLPWWVADDLRLAFWRPLASASHWLDYRLWPNTPALMHAHSLVWLGAAVVLVGRLYRRLGAGSDAGDAARSNAAPLWVAGLAAWLFALFSGHGVAASWIANRGALMAVVCAAACLLAHDRAAREGATWLELAAPLGLAAALLCGEIGLGVVAYLVAYALFIDPRGRRRGLASLLPALGVVVAWRAAYSWLGYGAVGSRMYIDPLAAPGAFIAAVFERAPLLLLGLLGGPPSHLTGLRSRPEQILASILAAVIVIAVLVVLVLALRRREDPNPLRFWVAGALGCCVPACATSPHDRLLILAAIGSSMAIALTLAHAARADASRGLRAVAAGWVPLLFVVGPITMVVDALSMRLVAAPQVMASASLPVDLDGRTLMVVNVPEPLSMCAQLPFYRAARGLSYPSALRCMGASEGAVELRRPNSTTLVLAADGGYLRGPNSALFDTAARGRFEGGSWDLGELRVEVLRVTADGRPEVVGFYFDAPLEALAGPERGAVWVVWGEAGFERFTLPAVGERVVLDAHALEEIADRYLAGER